MKIIVGSDFKRGYGDKKLFYVSRVLKYKVSIYKTLKLILRTVRNKKLNENFRNLLDSS